MIFMKKINETLLKELAIEVAPEVEKITEWDVSFEGLSIKPIKKNNLFNISTIKTFQYVGIDTSPRNLKEEKEFTLKKKIDSYTLMNRS